MVREIKIKIKIKKSLHLEDMSKAGLTRPYVYNSFKAPRQNPQAKNTGSKRQKVADDDDDFEPPLSQKIEDTPYVTGLIELPFHLKRY